MGLDYSFFLVFPKEHLWDALDGVVALAETDLGETVIHFPDGDRIIPLSCWGYNKTAFRHDDPQLSFNISLRFPEDEALLEYVRERDGADDWRAPPDPDTETTLSIGYIYLYIYADLRAFSKRFPDQGLVAMNFVSAGTTMSLLFDESTAMRNTFIDLLERHDGVYGVLNRELEADLFWWRGETVDISIGSIYIPPDEVDATVKRIQAGGSW